ncbi:hypothetical protein MBLNU459_g0174t1 [Dothideomycetes sp. NU459]
MAQTALTIRPGQSLGFMHLGASLYDTCTALRADSKTFRKLELSYSAQDPLQHPVIVNLPENGIRLRFDGPDQRLRLIEILDFHRSRFTYKNEDLVPHHAPNAATYGKPQSPLVYRRVYQLFGPSYPGEFIPPKDGTGTGIYVLSFPGIALSFPLQASAWSTNADHPTFLTTSASPVTSIAIFEGTTWPEARADLFLRTPAAPRSSAVAARPRETAPDEVEYVKVHGAGQLEVLRRTSPPFWIVLSQTTPQDLITELGPPDQICRRPHNEDDSPRKPIGNGVRRASSAMPRSYGSTPSSVSSTNTDTYETEFDDDDAGEGVDSVQVNEQYFCYFEHGFDILLGPPTDISPLPVTSGDNTQFQKPASISDSQTTVTRVIMHGNIPGSYPFNRHRRSRWSLQYLPDDLITSESKFNDFHQGLLQAFKGIWPEKEMQEGMVIVRSWGGDSDSPSGSAILIGGEMDEDMEDMEGSGWDKEGDGSGNGSEQWLKNTRLFKFPGLMFEVMHNGAVSALTVY